MLTLALLLNYNQVLSCFKSFFLPQKLFQLKYSVRKDYDFVYKAIHTIFLVFTYIHGKYMTLYVLGHPYNIFGFL